MGFDDRPRGILSPADRKYLRNPDELSRQAGYERRQAIIERVHQSLHDYPLLVSALDDESREKAFEDRFEEPLEESIPEKEHTINILSSAFAFLYLGLRDTVGRETALEAFESIAADGVKQAFHQTDTVIASVDVDVDITHGNPEKPIGEMTINELQEYAQCGEIDREVFVEEQATRLSSNNPKRDAEAFADALGITEDEDSQ